MKYLTPILLLICFFSGISLIMASISIENIAPLQLPPVDIVHTVFPVVLSVYELIARIIPTVRNISAVGWFINLLKKVSDALNVTK